MSAALAQPPWPVVYVNLDEDVERDRRMREEFAGAGLAATRFPASRWTRESEDVQRRHYSEALNARSWFRPLLPGEKGCYLSHLRAWQQLLDGGAQAMVVLEDDVRLQPGFGAALQALAAAPAGWDMVKLIGRAREKAARRVPLADGRSLVTYSRVPSMTAGYVVTRAGARKLVDSRIPFGRPIDIDIRCWWENGLAVRGLEPAPIALAETSLDSSIGDKLGGVTPAQRWRKFAFKLRYSALNAWHR